MPRSSRWCCRSSCTPAPLLRRQLHRLEQRPVRLRELRHLDRGLVLDCRRASWSLLTAGAWLFVQQRCRARAGGDPRERAALRISRPQRLAGEDRCCWSRCAVIAAIAGYVFAGVQMVVAPEFAGFVFGTELVIWVALGGRGTLIGPVIGTLLIDVEQRLPERRPAVRVEADHRRRLRAWSSSRCRRACCRWSSRRHAAAARRGRRSARRRRRRSAPAADDRALAGLRGRGQPALAVERRAQALRQPQGAGRHRLHGARAASWSASSGPNGAGKTTLMRCIADGAERSGGTRRGQRPRHRARCRRTRASRSASAASSRPPTCSTR